MQTKNARRTRGLVVGAVMLSFAGLTATPALAEGSWTSYISNWNLYNTSRTWSDGNTDAVGTSVRFTGCSTDNVFNSATLKLWKSVTGPDEDRGNQVNTCNRVFWGDVSAGSYYFELWGISSGTLLNVTTVKTEY
ncbi:hypothetical protein [Streptomyces sp. NPDC059256]|uniref:hypothetical protein n=1 Tax=Streptomyces sp. NPDC059256 TaxID=3346794 RepID=UPI0036A45C2D